LPNEFNRDYCFTKLSANRGGNSPGSSVGTAGAQLANSITGSSVNYAGGGIGGGNGSGAASPANSGKGGDAGPHPTSQTGGSGVVILRYPDTRTISFGGGVTGTESAASGGYKRATITAATAGTVSWS
jgi:hypothetical protein